MSDPVTGVASAFTMLLSVVNKTMDMLPDYEQRKKEKYHKLLTLYENEKSQEGWLRDDNLVGIYKNKLLRFISVFKEELDVKSEDIKR